MEPTKGKINQNLEWKEYMQDTAEPVMFSVGYYKDAHVLHIYYGPLDLMLTPILARKISHALQNAASDLIAEKF